MQYIHINKDIIPYTFDILLSDELFEFRIDYNNSCGFFTVSLSKDGETLCSGEPIVYGVPLFADLLTRGKFPKVKITPIDESKESTAVTFDNLSNTVFLQVTDYE